MINELCVLFSGLYISERTKSLPRGLNETNPFSLSNIIRVNKAKIFIDLTVDDSPADVIDINKFIGRGCVYFIKLIDHKNLYKYGCTKDIKKRIKTHERNVIFGKQLIVSIIDCDVFHAQVEEHVKTLASRNGTLTQLGSHVEIIKTNNIDKYINAAKRKANSYSGYTCIINNKIEC